MSSQGTKKKFEFQVGYVQCERCGGIMKQGEEETHAEVCLGQSTNPECAKIGCITDPCPRIRPPKKKDGFCVYYNNGKIRSAIEQKRVGGKQRNE